jgi:hypothetical protein
MACVCQPGPGRVYASTQLVLTIGMGGHWMVYGLVVLYVCVCAAVRRSLGQ